MSLSAAVVMGGGAFVVGTIGTHRFLSAIEGRALSDAEQARIMDDAMLVPVQVTTIGMLIGAVAALCVPFFLVGWLLQLRGGRRDGS